MAANCSWVVGFKAVMGKGGEEGELKHCPFFLENSMDDMTYEVKKRGRVSPGCKGLGNWGDT